MAQGPTAGCEVRAQLQQRLAGEVPAEAVHALADVALHLPVEVADYVDFYASEHHAANLGRLFRPDNPDPLMPNWKHLPVGYHGRAGSDRRLRHRHRRAPAGSAKAPRTPTPVFGPSTRLDIEAELGFVVGTGNRLGDPDRGRARPSEHLFGVVLFNDWSARDIQAWEYVPLGPNLGKSFASTVSAVGGAAGRTRRRPRGHAPPGAGAAALPRDERSPGASTSTSRSQWNGHECQPPAVRARCTGRRPRCSRT